MSELVDPSEVELVEPVNTNSGAGGDRPVVIVVKPSSFFSDLPAAFGDFGGFPGFGRFPELPSR